MPRPAISAAIEVATEGVRLLDHPYYQAWQDGSLRKEDLAAYAGQYRHFERTLPEVLARAASTMDSGAARRMVEANLDDELHNPRPHVELFEQFAAAVGSDPEAARTPATRDLVDLYSDAVHTGPVALLSVVGAYEQQAAAIASAKDAALRENYGLDAAATEFWAIHAGLEDQHSEWTVEALKLLDAPPAAAELWAGRSAQAWWAFLDERDAARAAHPTWPALRTTA